MKHKQVVTLLVPLLLANQLAITPVEAEEKKSVSHNYEFDINSDEEHEVVVSNDAYNRYQEKRRREKFHSLEQNLVILEEKAAALPKGRQQIGLGSLLASMSGGVLYGEKATT